ncbi:Membrane-associated phospholipid phosphatase [Salisediminibacterium beveridgei]|uniref:Membrane-associated phospholipid phosphatase n=1 Tax=Salisediminibacterium beveridgei TaxID=632773 RepID=A0A1D7QXV1_9BACI|nr:Membrane-associated phospholipid phosphatase [Salisediminibacterium beveridgei]
MLALFITRETAWIIRIDEAIQASMTTHSPDWLYTTMNWWTDLGSVSFFTTGTLLTALFIWIHPRIKPVWVLPLTVNMLGISALSTWMKEVTARPRPSINETVDAVSFSFPSAHASGSAAFYGFLILLVTLHVSHSRLKISLNLVLLFMMLTVSFSRLILNVHFFSDMLGGLLLGAGWLFIAIRTGIFLDQKTR